VSTISFNSGVALGAAVGARLGVTTGRSPDAAGLFGNLSQLVPITRIARQRNAADLNIYYYLIDMYIF
jgi:hypothetical protein